MQHTSLPQPLPLLTVFTTAVQLYGCNNDACFLPFPSQWYLPPPVAAILIAYDSAWCWCQNSRPRSSAPGSLLSSLSQVRSVQRPGRPDRAVERPSSLRTEAERGRGPSEPKRKGSPPLAWVSIGVEALRSPSERDPPLSLGLAFTPSPLPLFPLGERERRGGQPHPPQEGVPTRPCPQQGDIPRRRIGLSHTPPGSAVYAQQGTAGIYCEGKPPGQRC